MKNYLLRNVKVRLDDEQDFLDLIAAKMKINKSEIFEYSINKESIDARKKDDIFLNYSFVVKCENNVKVSKDIAIYEVKDKVEVCIGNKKLENRPVVVGAGPAGLFCAYILALNGYKPLILERGKKVEQRVKSIDIYFSGGELDIDSNIQFGEGGAGTFSDGKLNSGINDPKCNFVLNTFIEYGAPKEIRYEALPHIGTDKLRSIIPKIRKKIESLGGDFLFETRMTDVCFNKDNNIRACKIDDKEYIDTNCLILAIGHSARDTFEMLLERGVSIEQKPFSVGARIEHKQEFLDKAQFGKYANHPRLGKATYKLFTRDDLPTAYSFCMCPGGMVVAAASEENTVVTNGMSEYNRDRENCNAALVVAVSSRDFENSHPLAGVVYQRMLERRAYNVGEGCAPVQTVKGFLESKKDYKLGNIRPSYPREIALKNLNEVLPDRVNERMKTAISSFDRKINGFANPEALLTGVETRTSSPVRILRNEEFQAVGKTGLYLAGEGPGYAGGIMSAAVDGIKTALKCTLVNDVTPTF